MINEREIDFADQTAKRAAETGGAMGAYLKKLVEVALGYIDAAKVPGKADIDHVDCKFALGEWRVKVRSHNMNGEWKTPRLRLRYRYRLLAEIEFYEWSKETVTFESETKREIEIKRELMVDVLKLDTANLFYITGFIEAVDKQLTEMNAMVSKVI